MAEDDLFENAARVPLIIDGADSGVAGQATESLAEMVDFYPTLAELCHLDRPSYLQGRSLVAVLNDPAAAVRDSALTQYDSGYSLRTQRYRYTEWGPGGVDGTELYDHATDPQEMVNLARRPEQFAMVQELSEQLRRRVAAANQVPQRLQQVP